MTSNQEQASYRVDETKGHTQDSLMGAAKDRAAGLAGYVSGQGQGATDAAKHKAGEAKDKTSETAQAAKDKAARTAEAAKEKTVQSKEQAGSFLGKKTETAKQKASEAARYTQERSSDAARYAKESAVASKDKTGGVLQQATETVKGAVVGAKDAVVNTLGMGGDNAGDGATKDNTNAPRKSPGALDAVVRLSLLFSSWGFTYLFVFPLS